MAAQTAADSGTSGMCYCPASWGAITLAYSPETEMQAATVAHTDSKTDWMMICIYAAVATEL